MEWPVAMVTGHRPQHLDPRDLVWLDAELRRVLWRLHNEHGTRLAISGMAAGVDLMWAGWAQRHGIALRAHIPFPQQPEVWRDIDLATQWRRLRGYAFSTGGVREYGDLGNLVDPERKRLAVALLHERNDGMIAETVAASGVCVAALRSGKTDGGTWSAYQKALNNGRPAVTIIRVDPDRQRTTIAAVANQATDEYEQETLPL